MIKIKEPSNNLNECLIAIKTIEELSKKCAAKLIRTYRSKAAAGTTTYW
jgi:hypothetical protein